MEKLELAKSAVIMIDMQDKLLNVMNSPEQILEQSVRMLKYSNALNVPVLATEQYRKGHVLHGRMPQHGHQGAWARCE